MRINISTPVGICEIGGRAKQEDAIYPKLSDMSQESQVMVVCDGLGGLELGEVASDTVAQTLGRWVEKNVDLETPISMSIAFDAVAAAQMKLNNVCEKFDPVHSMGTTMAMIVLGNNGIVAAHIGDSRIYHIRPAEKKILYRSRDHSLVNDLFQMGRLTRQEAEASPKKNILTRAMMPAPATAAQPDVALISDIKAGDYFMLCSDGLTGEVSDERILGLLARTDMGEAMKVAALQVMAKDGTDNRSIVLVRVERVEHEPGETLLVSNEDAMCDRMVKMDVVPEEEASLPAVPSAPATVASVTPTEPPAVPQQAIEAAGVAVGLPPAIPAAAQSETVDSTPLPPTEALTGNEEVHYDYSKPKKKGNNTLRRAGLILLLGLLLAAGITTYFALNKPKANVPETPASDTLADPDVSIDSMLPVMPNDSLAVGTDVSVPRAPGIGNVPLPNTEPPAPAPSTSYPKGSSVNVPKAPKYNGNNTPPYDPYDGSGGFGSDEPIRDEEPAPTSNVSNRRSTSDPIKPDVDTRSNSGAVPPAVPQGGKKSKSDPGAVVGGSVPPPPGRGGGKTIETP